MSEATARADAGLPSAPSSLVGADGAPQMGLFAGPVADASLAQLKPPYAAGPVDRRLIEKKWQYVHVATPEMMLALAIIDTGYLASGICSVFDRGSRRLLANENPVLPSIAASLDDAPNASARLYGPGIRATIRNGEVRASWGHVDVDLKLDLARAARPMTAIAKVGTEGRFDFTQKTVLVPAEGEVRAGNIGFAVQGQLAGLDFTHGFLARETAWRWAFASGRSGDRAVAFNFSEGFLQGAGENVVWLDGEPKPAGKVGFTFQGSEASSPWQIRSASGEVDLVFQPEGHRAQSIDLKLIRSRYVQPFGTFSGKLFGVQIENLAGVTEDHAARW